MDSDKSSMVYSHCTDTTSSQLLKQQQKSVLQIAKNLGIRVGLAPQQVMSHVVGYRERFLKPYIKKNVLFVISQLCNQIFKDVWPKSSKFSLSHGLIEYLRVGSGGKINHL